MKKISELNAFAASKALGGAKLPHGLSNPVLRELDGNICVCYFVYTYNRQARETGLYPRPSEWIALSIEEGDLVGRFRCSENDFSTAPYDKTYSVKDASVSAQSKDHYAAMCQLIEEARSSVIATGCLDRKTYEDYLNKLFVITPKDFRVFYTDLSL